MPIKPVLYRFETCWQLQATLPEVWSAIYDSDNWPQWWKGVKSVRRIRESDVNGLHAINAYVWKSWLPYELHFQMELMEEEQLSFLRCKASGELAGEGIFNISEMDGIVTVQYNWNVYTQKAWMNVLAPLAKPFFYYNHKVVMQWGAAGLARKLNARLVSFSSKP